MQQVKTAAFLVILVLLSGVAMAGEYQVSKKVDGFDVVVTLDKNPPVAGKNVMTIAVKDDAGKPVSDIKVRVDYTMPAMPGMPAMNYKTDASPNGQSFTAPIDFSMSGAWNVAVKILREGKTSTVKFNVDAR
ncbi:MAG: FixH family protein [Desulforhopalus sp.]|nr:FixH family protein [Desulforhopalus sp.]